MKKTILTMLLAFFAAFPAYASHTADHKAFQTVTVKVDGLVCDFCARALEKVFYQQEGVEGVNVDLDTHAVTLDLSESAALPDDKISDLITRSGYKVVEINRETAKHEQH